MISAASHQLIFFAMAFNNTSCIFIIRSTSAAGYRFAFSNHSASPLPPQSGQITCELDRTDHILTTAVAVLLAPGFRSRYDLRIHWVAGHRGGCMFAGVRLAVLSFLTAGALLCQDTR